MHADDELHATPLRPLSAPARLGVGSTRQIVPFHHSASTTCTPLLFVELPTATHDAADVHATALSSLPRDPAGLGVGSTRHAVPSHRSANVPNELEPTTVHAAADTHATPLRFTPVAPAGLGVETIRHARPSQRSASLTTAPDLVVEPPTATHDEALEQESAEKKPVRTSPFGLDTIDQPAADALAPPADDPTTNAANTKARNLRTNTLHSLAFPMPYESTATLKACNSCHNLISTYGARAGPRGSYHGGAAPLDRGDLLCLVHRAVEDLDRPVDLLAFDR